WISGAEASYLSVNRPVAFSIPTVRPHPAWHAGVVGEAAMVGGPNELLTWGRWKPVDAEPGRSVRMTGVEPSVAALVEAAQPSMDYLEFDRVRAAARSDQHAWASEFSRARERRGSGFERTVFRYRPVPTTVRLAEGATPAEL